MKTHFKSKNFALEILKQNQNSIVADISYESGGEGKQNPVQTSQTQDRIPPVRK